MEDFLETTAQSSTDDLKGNCSKFNRWASSWQWDAVIGINPATDNVHNAIELLKMLDGVRKIQNLAVLRVNHVTNTMKPLKKSTC